MKSCIGPIIYLFGSMKDGIRSFICWKELTITFSVFVHNLEQELVCHQIDVAELVLDLLLSRVKSMVENSCVGLVVACQLMNEGLFSSQT